MVRLSILFLITLHMLLRGSSMLTGSVRSEDEDGRWLSVARCHRRILVSRFFIPIIPEVSFLLGGGHLITVA